ncbi:hypothetical protein AMJ71_02055 [candidate division TA06 bacterium SM1_40]|uniref:Polyprenyl synthetase n=2 Tax=Bacteria division TA06 TaxID=1156500 RepID=A0A0S8JLX0_UNCT6|nr:MAG: hypothetical protein AMJ82_03500 [candidate division TA06 bacterium SM23_40]KPL10751.1 MAG: hypothetical protein AMJ71_02055 [candidate division TA06 bacterium SM1_40]
MSLELILAPIVDDLLEVGRALEEELRSEIPAVDRVTRHLLSGRGKLLRPALVILASRSIGEGVSKSAIRAATMIEMIHMATLVHDDMVDGAETRRGIATLNHKWSDRVSVLAGDYVYSRALAMLSHEEMHPILGIVAETVCRMSAAELIQTDRRGDVTMREEEYLSIAGDKTASLIRASCRIGSVLADGSKADREALSDFGWNFGIAFQIVDDLLDFVGSGRKMGKPVGVDLRDGRVTLPLLYMLKEGSTEERQRIAQMLDVCGVGTEESWEEAIALVKERGGVERTREVAGTYTERAKEAIDTLAPSQAKDTLLLLADFVVDRDG